MLVVTGVGFLIHLYATSYMADDKGYARFFAYLNLFIFSMLVLILGDNLPLLFVGWEGVGLCSYLLIGFWYENDANARRARRRSSPIASVTSACCAPCSFWRTTRVRSTGTESRTARAASSTRAKPGAFTYGRSAAASTRGSSTSCNPSGRSPSAPRRPWALRFCSGAPARARRSLFTSGCRTRWPAPLRCPRSSTRPRW
jgi:hypothetical protein